MELQYINIRRNESYEARPGQFKGTLQFKGKHGQVEIPLDETLSAEVLKLCSASLTRATKDLANNLTAAVFEQASDNLLENKE